MSYKQFTLCVFWGTVVCLLSVIAISYIVDPIGIWGTPKIEGVNQSKIKQSEYIDVFKPYEISRIKPEIIWIGTSRVYVGFPMEERRIEYNMGASALSLKDIKKYLQFIYKEHIPNRVYLGIDLLQFTKKFSESYRPGFSEARLVNINSGLNKKLIQKINDSFGVIKSIYPTVIASIKKQENTFVLGQDISRGRAEGVNSKAYYGTLTQYRETYLNFDYDEQAMMHLKEIVQEAEEHDVELILFINPVSVDLQLMQYVTEQQYLFYRIKKEIASFHPLYDFCWINQYTTNRDEYFYDASHFRENYGVLCKSAMYGDDNGTALYMADNNVDEYLKQEKAFFADWINNNQSYYNFFVARFNDKRHYKEGELKEYIGF